MTVGKTRNSTAVRSEQVRLAGCWQARTATPVVRRWVFHFPVSGHRWEESITASLSGQTPEEATLQLRSAVSGLVDPLLFRFLRRVVSDYQTAGSRSQSVLSGCAARRVWPMT